MALKSSSAFTLPEVMLALFILSSSVFVMSELQLKSLFKVWYAREDIDRIYHIKKYVYKALISLAPLKRQKQTLDDPDMILQVEPISLHKKSSLAPYAAHLSLVKGEGMWHRGTRETRLSLVGLKLIQSEVS